MFNRIQTMIMLGLVLIAVGTAVAVAVRVVSFSRYMRLEDLGLDVDPALGTGLFSQIVAPTTAERTMFYAAVALIPVGLVLLILALRRRPLAGG
ncbi:hypothetical protein [Arthrobacter sp. AL12]|uniref:hypothetical protein n=1 Tax=Arthrobacter sp. AL12 TaxID=3042241 RepID=UPI00249C0808|nr:hypothetical protein [Arthrobacter sp. AL12]MDI3211042.1 hypothetical protein [Arthrobacter sp. AL12]